MSSPASFTPSWDDHRKSYDYTESNTVDNGESSISELQIQSNSHTRSGVINLLSGTILILSASNPEIHLLYPITRQDVFIVGTTMIINSFRKFKKMHDAEMEMLEHT